MLDNLLAELDTVLAEWSPPYPQDSARLRRIVDDARTAHRAEPGLSAVPKRSHTAITRQRILDAIEILEALAAPQQ